MSYKTRAVVTVIGHDRVGILNRVAEGIASANCNVIEITQSVLEDFFTMIMIIDITDATMSVDELQQSIDCRVPDMKVYVMHEEIFDAMHRI